MYTLIIKGDENAAWAACSVHGVEVTSIARHSQFDECILTTPSHADTHELLTRWFCEHTGLPPAPAGTLMWYGPRQDLPVANPPVKGWDKVEGGTDA